MDRIYPQHIYDETRIEIASDILGKEFAKLAGSKTDDELVGWRGRIKDSFNGIDIVASPIHDFWCTFELLPLVKTKRLCRFVTAENVTWKLEKKELDSLKLTWMPFIEENVEAFGEGPWPISHLKRVFSKDSRLWDQAQQINTKNLRKYGFNHVDEPITLVELTQDKYLLDGNGRLYEALMAGKKQINCWVGYLNESKPKDYWVSTGLMKNLCYEIIDNPSESKVKESAIILLNNYFQESKIARINYDLWIKEYFPELDSLLQF